MVNPAFDFEFVVHATHEAGFKVGGIGAVLDGLLAAPAYNAAVRRTLLIGPMDVNSATEMSRLTDPRNRLTIHYSSWHNINTPPESIENESDWQVISSSLQAIEALFQVRLLYGRRFLGNVEHEILLVDARHARAEETNAFKYELWEHYHIRPERYEVLDEFDLTVKAARPAFAALTLLAGETTGARFIIAHEWMGIPLALTAQIQSGMEWHLVFYAHEMATARILVEDHAGHDTRFYNALRLARQNKLNLDQVFGDRNDFFKHALIKQAPRLDLTLAVGDWVVEELRFLGGGFETTPIELAYNGIPSEPVTIEERHTSKGRLQHYCQNLLGYRPDYIFSHVTRLVVSKGLWRDLRVLEHLDPLLAAEGKTAVHYMLSTSAPTGRLPADVMRWEQEYGWPIVHRTDNGDLVWLEIPMYAAIEAFNAHSQAIKIVLINQYGWDQAHCGMKMPPDMSFKDLRRGADLEFGQSVYEPFGIAQVEPLGFGALCVVSNICGCVGFAEQAAHQAGLENFPNLIIADYTTPPSTIPIRSPWEALKIGQETRDALEITNSSAVARTIFAALPRTEHQAQQLLDQGQQVSRRMSWEVVAQEYLLPALARLCN